MRPALERALLALALVLSCAGRRPELRLSAGSEVSRPSLDSLWRQLSASAERERSAFVVAEHAAGLLGAGLGSSNAETRVWRSGASVTRAPVLGDRVVVYGERTQFVAIDGASGERLWSVPAGGARLTAASDDGRFTVLTLEDPRSARRWLAVHDRTGRTHLSVEADAAFGGVLMLEGSLIVPWDQRALSVIDVASRSEMGREDRATPVTRVFTAAGGLIAGGPPWHVLGAEPEAAYHLPQRPLPGRIEVGSEHGMPDAEAQATYVFMPPVSDPGPEPRAVYAASYGRLILGFEAADGVLRWARALPARALAGALFHEVLAICDASGSVQTFRVNNGVLERRLRVMTRVASVARLAREGPWSACVISAGRVLPDGSGLSREPEAPASLVEQLSHILALPDPDLADAQRFLSRELSVRPEPEATRVLIELATRLSADRVLADEAEDLLASRRNGVGYMLEALDSTTEGEGAGPLPPLGGLALALGALEEPRAAAPLARHLNHPGYSPRALAAAARALEVLATPAEYRMLSIFFSLQRGIARDAERAEAVLSVARALLRIEPEDARRLIRFALRDPLTVPEVRTPLERLVADVVSAPGTPESAPDAAR